MELLDNMGNIVAGVFILAIVCVVIAVLIKNKKNGKSSCGCGCEHCAASSSCHKTK